jgi:hypothetical protein
MLAIGLFLAVFVDAQRRPPTGDVERSGWVPPWGARRVTVLPFAAASACADRALALRIFAYSESQ